VIRATERPVERPVDHSYVRQSSPAPQKNRTEADQRSALRAAIEGARKSPITSPVAPIHSPADLLRARMQKRTVFSSSKTKQPEPVTQSFRSTDFRSVRPPQPPPQHEQERQPVHHGEVVPPEKDAGSGEISPELLKRVINDGGHDQDTSDS
jgi:hypothetical protein